MFLHNRASGSNTLVSHVAGSPNTSSNWGNDNPSISADGSYVAFQSGATNLATDGNGVGDVFLYERATNLVRLVSRSPASSTTTANDWSVLPTVSADGQFVAFLSSAGNLLPAQLDVDDTNDVFLFERATGTVTLVSRVRYGDFIGGGADAWDELAMNGDASYLAFRAKPNHVVPGQNDANNAHDVFLFERATGEVALLSHVPGSATTTANQASGEPVMSVQGTTVAFGSMATNLVAGQSEGNTGADLFLYAPAPPAPPEMAIGDVKISEGDGGSRTAYVPVTLSAPSPTTVSVQYATADGAATQPGDYTHKTGTASIVAGAVSTRIPITVKGDASDESNEGFTVKLSSPTGATVVDGSGVVTIVDDDPNAGDLRLTVGDITLTEGDAKTRTARLTVSLSSAPASKVTVDWATADLTATQPDDYVAMYGAVAFDAGVTQNFIDVSVKGDTAAEVQEQFKVMLSNATGGATITDGTGLVTIRTDD